MVYPGGGWCGRNRRPGRSRFGIPKGRRRQSQGTRGSKEQTVEEVGGRQWFFPSPPSDRRHDGEWQCMVAKSDSYRCLVARLSTQLVSPGFCCWRYASSISASCCIGRRVSCQPGARNRPLCLFVRQLGLLDLLRFTIHDRFSEDRHFARHWLVSWGDY